jgi:hypothetical protein
MIIFYCKGIRLRLEEKSIDLLESMKRILDLGASISQLNSAASGMMSILIIFFLERTILGIKNLYLYQMNFIYNFCFFFIKVLCYSYSTEYLKLKCGFIDRCIP